MNIVFLGAPGAGKGTQAKKLAERLNIPHISTGDIFRQNIKDKTPIGMVVKGYIDKGQLCPDEVTEQIVKERLANPDCVNGYILDGFPRDVAQAEALSTFSHVDAVIDIVIPTERLMRRLTGRRVCDKCGASYHVDLDGNATVCGKCGGNVIQRADDTEATVANRLDVYRTQTAPLIEYYGEKGLLIDVDGDRSVDQVFNAIVEVLK